jgi:squalene-associated FAD-dependent desaturase
VAERLRVAVVGGGWSGLSAAVALARRGASVTVFEAAPQLGGRARTVRWVPTQTTAPLAPAGAELAGQPAGTAQANPTDIDNGQHLLIGGYRETLALLAELGGDLSELFDRRPFELISDCGLHLKLAPGQQAWRLLECLLGAQGLSWADRFALLRLPLYLRLRQWRPLPGWTVTRLLDATAQTSGSRRRIWEPLCLSALNTPADQACATVFASVLRDSLGGPPGAADFLIPRVSLGDTLPALGAAALVSLGAQVRLRHPVSELSLRDGRPVVNGEPFDGVILAVPPPAARRLTQSDWIPVYRYEPITTISLLVEMPAPPAPLPLEMVLLEGGPAHWLFSRPVDRDRQLVAMVISARSAQDEWPTSRLISACCEQWSRLREPGHDRSEWLAQRGWGGPDLIRSSRVLGAQVIREKRATFACTPGLLRPQVDVLQRSHPMVMVAGDWTASEYPATLETAVRSGKQAATRLLELHGPPG